jgi:hypothetical protein
MAVRALLHLPFIHFFAVLKISKLMVKAPAVGAEGFKEISFFHNTPPCYGILQA